MEAKRQIEIFHLNFHQGEFLIKTCVMLYSTIDICLFVNIFIFYVTGKW